MVHSAGRRISLTNPRNARKLRPVAADQSATWPAHSKERRCLLFTVYSLLFTILEMSNPRTRTITWEDPRALAKAAIGLSGMEYLQKIVSGELPPPPIGALMNFRIGELSEGHAVFVVEPAEYHYNPNRRCARRTRGDATRFRDGRCGPFNSSRRGELHHVGNQGQLYPANVRGNGPGPLRSEDHSRRRPHRDG